MKNILVATDGSANADRAIHLASQLAAALGAKLRIVNVIREYDVVPDDIGELSRAEHLTPPAFLDAVSERVLATAVSYARRHGVSDVQAESRKGDVQDCILRIARQEKADMIVVGKRGLGRLAGLLLGSVSQKIVSLASCAVMVIP